MFRDRQRERQTKVRLLQAGEGKCEDVKKLFFSVCVYVILLELVGCRKLT